ncbi:MAG: helix-turn-helix domain-containing protein [Gammaproteobacteria bacterium]|nr:helix-turn-helix domain-containing protein [Gammaproteobacteria bacterium]MDH5345637.1 helix-turn-helix domain-containing protein [Gammaproteobacteria bacterium]
MGEGEREIEGKSSTVHSVVVATQLLEYLAESGRPQRVTDIAAFLGMTKARVSRHLSTLADLGMVARMPDKSGYRLGPTLFRLSNAALDQYEITNIAYRYMVVLRNQIQEALLLAIPAGGDALVVSTVASGKSLGPQLVRGTRWSIPTSPTASVILAFSPEFVRERVLARRTERSAERTLALDPVAQRKEFAQIQRHFYAFHEDPHDAGFSVLSAPVFDHAERLEAALTIVMNKRPGSVNQETRFVKPLKETAIEISRALGSVEMAGKMAATL